MKGPAPAVAGGVGVVLAEGGGDGLEVVGVPPLAPLEPPGAALQYWIQRPVMLASTKTDWMRVKYLMFKFSVRMNGVKRGRGKSFPICLKASVE